MAMFCVSDRAFDDYLTKDETKNLRATYRENGFTQFHYMNAAYRVRDNGKRCEFYSYYTRVLAYEVRDTYTVLMVSPFIWNTDKYRNSSCTNRQANKWLYENGFDTSVQELREIYRACVSENANKLMPIYNQPPIHNINDDYNEVLPIFIQAQQYINRNEHDKYHGNTDNPKPPYLALYRDALFLA